jgi:hypothetical protein
MHQIGFLEFSARNSVFIEKYFMVTVLIAISSLTLSNARLMSKIRSTPIDVRLRAHVRRSLVRHRLPVRYILFCTR